MFSRSGLGSNAKVVKYRLAPQEGDTQLYALTPRQVKALLSNTDYLSWRNRHISFPSDIDTQDKLEAWVSNLNLSLMTPIEMDCDFLKDCLVSLLGADEDIRSLLDSIIGQEIQKTIDTMRLPETGETSGNILGLITDCDLDILYGKIVGLITSSIQRISDFFEELEVHTNTVEVADFLFQLPMVNLAGAQSITSFINTALEAVSEAFAADVNQDYIDEITCDIFCSLVDTCDISIDNLFDYFHGRINDQFSIENITELLLSVMDMDIEGFNTADGWLAFFFGALKIANWILPIDFGIEKFIKTIARFDEPNNDWIAICENCEVEEPVDPACEDLKLWPNTWKPVTGNAVHTLGQGWGPYNTGAGGWLFRIEKDRPSGMTPKTYYRMKIYLNAPIAGLQVRLGSTTHYTNGSTSMQEFILDESNAPGLFPMSQNASSNSLIITFNNAGPVPSTFRVERVCLYETP